MTVRDNRDNIGVLLYSYYTTITGWGVLIGPTQKLSLQLDQFQGSPKGGYIGVI